ncbi:LPS export ABC transporter periplasmic protein LptC [Tenacibaculum sp. UWU-22]|uniref:LPS export ABC transporter periplasmic protein LptC n=1 Tax=Tenacibaculum sp. UWU-22 TaxID=3234187 RepID=UPI0034DAD09D
MQVCKKIIIKNIAALVILAAMFFSCTNNPKEVRDFLVAKNLPISVAKNVRHVYKDSGRITSKLITPLLYDFSNRKDHPYNEFPEGIKIVKITNKGKDSITITGNYALVYNKTGISEIKDKVIIINHAQHSKLETEELFWDQKQGYYFTEEAFKLTTQLDTLKGVGFESKEDLSNSIAKNITGSLEIRDKQ